jgi:hypothetical protein
MNKCRRRYGLPPTGVNTTHPARLAARTVPGVTSIQPQPPLIGMQKLSDALAAIGAYAEAPTEQDLAAAVEAEGTVALTARLANALYGCALRAITHTAQSHSYWSAKSVGFSARTTGTPTNRSWSNRCKSPPGWSRAQTPATHPRRNHKTW